MIDSCKLPKSSTSVGEAFSMVDNNASVKSISGLANIPDNQLDFADVKAMELL